MLPTQEKVKVRKKGARLNGMPTEEVSFIKELSDCQEGSGEQAGGSGSAQETGPLRLENCTSTMTWDNRSKASDAEETN